MEGCDKMTPYTIKMEGCDKMTPPKKIKEKVAWPRVRGGASHLQPARNGVVFFNVIPRFPSRPSVGYSTLLPFILLPLLKL